MSFQLRLSISGYETFRFRPKNVPAIACGGKLFLKESRRRAPASVQRPVVHLSCTKNPMSRLTLTSTVRGTMRYMIDVGTIEVKL